MRLVGKREDAPLPVEQVKLTEIHRAAWNPRTISEFQLRALEESMSTFGVVEPIVVNADGTILGGHQRYMAALELGWTELPAVRVDLPQDQAQLLNLALNKISGQWEPNDLAALINEITEEPIELLVAGFDSEEVEQLLTRFASPPDTEVRFKASEREHLCPECGHVWRGQCRP